MFCPSVHIIRLSYPSDPTPKYAATFLALSVDLKNAAVMLTSDFEDALQICCAKRIKADYIITRNIRAFENSKILALKSTEFLERL